MTARRIRSTAPFRRGDIVIADLPPPVGRRPVLIVTRSRAIDVRTAVTVAPVTRTSRGIASEVPLGWSEGLRAPSVANCDSLMTIPKASLSLRIGTLSRDRRTALDHALAYALEIRSLG